MDLKQQLYNEVVKAAIAYGQYIAENMQHPADALTLLIANGIEGDNVESQFVGAGDPKACACLTGVAMRNYEDFNRIVSTAVLDYQNDKKELFSNN